MYNLANEGKYIEKIIPSAGFCERTEIFFGLKPNESGFFTAIGFDPDNSPYKRSRMLTFIGFIEELVFRLASLLWKKKQNSIEYHFRRLLLKFFYLFNKNNKRFGTYNIPFNFLKYFNLTEDEFDLHKIDKLSKKESLFKLVSKLNGKTYMGAFTALGQKSNGDDKNRIKLAIEACRKNDNFFIPVYLSVTDSYGHNFGPNSKEKKNEINKLDILLKDSVQKLLEIDNDTKFLEPIAEEQQSLDSSNGTPLQRQQNITYHNDEENWVNICLRCPTKGTCITCGSQNPEPPRELLRSKSVCICDAKDHYKGHEH